VSVDYRLLHHFRVSQRREMASRGEPAVLRLGEHAVDEHSGDESGGVVDQSAVDEPDLDGSLVRTSPPSLAEATRPQVLTHLLNEDR
jgi:hypothetical protein